MLVGRTMSMSFAEVVPEESAGPLVRLIGRSAQDSPETWSLATKAFKPGDTVSIAVNGEILDAIDEVPDGLWRSFDFELVRYGRVKMGEEVIASLAEVGGAAISAVLSGVFANGLFGYPMTSHEGLPEGSVMTIQVNKYERSPVNRQRCISHYGSSCWVCEMDFGDTYGPSAKGYIEVHHRVPVSQLGENYIVDPIRDLIPLCSNCHSAAHTRNPPFSPAELRSKLGKPVKFPNLPEVC